MPRSKKFLEKLSKNEVWTRFIHHYVWTYTHFTFWQQLGLLFQALSNLFLNRIVTSPLLGLYKICTLPCCPTVNWAKVPISLPQCQDPWILSLSHVCACAHTACNFLSSILEQSLQIHNQQASILWEVKNKVSEMVPLFIWSQFLIQYFCWCYRSLEALEKWVI